jgi:antitoxin MazE
MKTTVARWGNSLGVRVPKEVAAEVGLTEGAAVTIAAEAGRIVISPAVPRYTLEELLVGMTPEAMHEAFDWGPDVGREIVD